jgi:diguanylate cyclase
MFAHNSSEMQIPEGFSVPWNDSLCKRALDDRCRLATMLPALALVHRRPGFGDRHLFQHSRAPDRRLIIRHAVRHQPGKTAYNLEGEQVMGLFAKLISHYVEKETLVQQLRRLTSRWRCIRTDELRALPNRRSLFKHLAAQFSQAREQQRSVLLIFIDLDDFKAINDRFGHPCGDSFLIQIGERLAARVRSGDIVGRLGGDEFLIVGPGPDSADQQEYIAALRQAGGDLFPRRTPD